MAQVGSIRNRKVNNSQSSGQDWPLLIIVMSYISTRWLLLLGLWHLSNKNKFTIEYKYCYKRTEFKLAASITPACIVTHWSQLLLMPWMWYQPMAPESPRCLVIMVLPPLSHSSQILSIYLLSVHYPSIAWLRIMDRHVAYRTEYIFILYC